MVDDNTAGGAGTHEGDARATAIHFVTRDVSDEEAAAVTAVLLAALDETTLAASVAEPARNAWVQSAGALRTPLAVGPGAWGRSGR
jgi:hypothetical protein